MPLSEQTKERLRRRKYPPLIKCPKCGSYRNGTEPRCLNLDCPMHFDATDRISEVQEFSLAECQVALKLPDLQKTVRAAVERRIRALKKAEAAICICTKKKHPSGRDNPYCRYPHGGIPAPELA